MKRKLIPYLYVLELKKVVLAPFRVFHLKRSTAEAFAVTFTVLSTKNMKGDKCFVFKLANPYGDTEAYWTIPENIHTQPRTAFMF